MPRFRLLAVAAVATTALTGLVPATALAQGNGQDGQPGPGSGQGPDPRVSPGEGGGTAEGLLCSLFKIRCNR